MTARLEFTAFGLALAALIAVPLGPALFGDRVLSPSDLAYVQRSFERAEGPSGYAYEPSNRLLTDPMLQFEPWIEFNRQMIRQGRLPLWNDRAGCGVPHLANGQSSVFDPFLVIAYVGSMPEALAWIAAARLWVAGVGMFILASLWGLGRWGRWFAGLCFPLCGFMTLWLLYPLASVAAWLPWLIASTEWLLRRPGPRSVGVVAGAAALTILGGHIQTAAHCLMLAAVYVLVRIAPVRRFSLDGEALDRPDRPVRGVLAWASAMALGLATASVAIIPLGFYLSRSPAWEDRVVEKGSPWTIAAPRVLEAATTAFPNLFGSQRRGQPNLARALGANNQNEAAAGFAGLGTLLWLAPLGVAFGKRRIRGFLVLAVGIGACASFRVAPLDNVLRALPVLEVTDHRRMTLWIAFGLVGLGAIGIDRLSDWKPSSAWRAWIGCWALAALGIAAVAAALPGLESSFRERAITHYRTSAEQSPDLTSEDAQVLADRQVRNLTEGYPSSLFLSATLLASLAAVASWVGTRNARSYSQSRMSWVQPIVLAIVALDLVASMWGANPMIAPEDFRPRSDVLEHLRREAAPPARVLSIGAELPPNMLMRYGLADVRCYDAIELATIVDWLAPLFESNPEISEARTSRRLITWEGVARAQDRLRDCGVVAVVGATSPPEGLFDRVVTIGRVWVGHWEPLECLTIPVASQGGRVTVEIPDQAGDDRGATLRKDQRIQVSIVYDPGWRAWCEWGSLPVSAGPGPFLGVEVPAGVGRLELVYDPPEVRVAIGLSLAGLAGIVLLAGLGSGKNGSMALGPARRLALESNPMVTGGDPNGSAPQSEGHDADGPLHV